MIAIHFQLILDDLHSFPKVRTKVHQESNAKSICNKAQLWQHIRQNWQDVKGSFFFFFTHQSLLTLHHRQCLFYFLHKKHHRNWVKILLSAFLTQGLKIAHFQLQTICTASCCYGNNEEEKEKKTLEPPKTNTMKASDTRWGSMRSFLFEID